MKSTEEKLKEYDKIKDRELKYRIRVKLLLMKCKEKGIEVSDKEINDEMVKIKKG